MSVSGEIPGKWIDLSVPSSANIKHSKNTYFATPEGNARAIVENTIELLKKDFQVMLILF